jgi:hypothetical protein
MEPSTRRRRIVGWYAGRSERVQTTRSDKRFTEGLLTLPKRDAQATQVAPHDVSA